VKSPRLFHLLAGLGLLLLPCTGKAANCVVNLSHYDEMRPDFERMAKSGIVGVIHEATYPGAEDEKYASRQAAARKAGLLWGAYHFADGTDPVRQADRFLNVVSRHSNGSPVLLVLDFEKNDHYRGGTMTVAQAVKFVERVHDRTGQYPGLYASENRIKLLLDHPTTDPAAKRILSKCWLWIANYHHEPKATSPWSTWTMWQYTGDGICDLPRRTHPISIANIPKAERNLYRGGVGSARNLWQERSWGGRGS